jgi:acetoin utilization protein AcuB
MTQTIREYMVPAPHSIGFDQSVLHARQKMHEHHIRHLPVLRGGEVVGVLSERDITYVESLPGVKIEELRVEEAMSQDPYTFAPETPLREVAAKMAEFRLGAALIVQAEHCIGIFTTTDALEVLSRVAVLPAPK